MSNESSVVKPFLVRPEPFDLESLESYLIRVGLANGFNGLEWIRHLDLLTSRNMNFLQCKEDIEKLCLVLNISEENLQRLTVTRFQEEYLFYLRISAEPKRHTKYCPVCLKDQKIQHIFWALDYTKICPIHNAELVSNCKACGRSVINLVKDKCTCGYVLSNSVSTMKVFHLIDIMIKEYLRNIIFSRNNSLSLDQLSKAEYINLSKIIDDYLQSLEQEDIEYFFDITQNPVDGKSDVIKDYYLKDWPHKFRIFLTKLSNLHHKKKDLSTVSIFKEFNSFIPAIMPVLRESVRTNMLLSYALRYYYYHKFNISFYASAYRTWLDESNATEVSVIIKILNIKEEQFKQICRHYSWVPIFYREQEYYQIEIIRDFLLELIFPHNGVLLMDYPARGWLSFNDALNNHSIIEIVSMIKNRKLQTAINIFGEGLNSILIKRQLM
ncbi:TniQ family protein [Dethiobacter alkaliphilus]|uniref:TniQ family protein n=1 Tax=Dethiobacter alkaliphilus TaxID=427926 RepID=UPI00222753FE|nr:TniQ family protein [Dethiobacter alkaliphilus]MCW3491330.1 TniQ family protein [Dethiobacter alkaliphilus]